MTLLTPTLLLAATGVLVPIVIHLFGRPRPRRVRFPSLRLLSVAHRERQSRSRLLRVLALLLRCLAIILLALALSLPVTDARWLAPLGRPAASLAVLIDVSLSMRDGAGAQPPIERARLVAARALEAPGEDGLVATAGLRARPVELPAGTGGADARNVVASVRAGDERAALPRCLGELTALGVGPGDTVVLISDLQATSLEGRANLPRGLKVVAVDVGAPVGANRALAAVEEPGGVVLRGRPATLTATVRAWGAGTAGTTPLSAIDDRGTLLGGAVATVMPGKDSHAEIEVTPASAGLLTGEVYLPADDFRPDDARGFVMRVRTRLRVLICGDAEETRFLRTALDPFPPGDTRSTVAPELVGADDLSQERLGRADVIVVARPANLDAQQRWQVAGAVRRGAGLLVFTGPGQDAAELTQALAELGFAGVEAGAPQVDPNGRVLAELATHRPPLSAFAAPGAGDPCAARFTTTRPLTIAEAAEPVVLASYDDGAPALIESAVGRGRALLLATAPDDAWSDLPRLPVYVALMHRLAGYLAAGREPATLGGSPGETVVLTVPDLPPDARLTGPDGAEVAMERVEDGVRFTPDRRGVYRLVVGSEEVAAVAVNPDPAESDPRSVTDPELAARLEPAEVVRVRADDFEAVSPHLQRSTDLSALCVLLALIALAADAGLVQRGTRATVNGDGRRQ